MPVQSSETMALGHVGSGQRVVEVEVGRIGFVGIDFLPIRPSE